MPLSGLQRAGWEGSRDADALSRKTCLKEPNVSSRYGTPRVRGLRRAGGTTIAQDPQTCAAEWMPKVAIREGGASHVMAPEEIASWLTRVSTAMPVRSNP